MPGFFYQPHSRRNFLARTGKTLAALSLASPLRALAQNDPAAADILHLGLISDTHIPADPENNYRHFYPVKNLQAVVPQILQSAPEAVLLDGDAARLTGELEDYQALRELLEPLAAQAPIYIGLGNHDDRENFFKVFKYPPKIERSVPGKHVLVLEWAPIRIVLLDSLLYPNKTPGLLGKAQRTWLAGFLEKSDNRPTVIFVHHTLGDRDGDLLDVERLFRIIQPQAKVKAVFYGHSHEYSFMERDGIHLVNMPAVGYNFSDAEPVGWMDARFSTKGVELVLHAIGGNREKDGERTLLTWRDGGQS